MKMIWSKSDPVRYKSNSSVKLSLSQAQIRSNFLLIKKYGDFVLGKGRKSWGWGLDGWGWVGGLEGGGGWT